MKRLFVMFLYYAVDTKSWKTQSKFVPVVGNCLVPSITSMVNFFVLVVVVPRPWMLVLINMKR